MSYLLYFIPRIKFPLPALSLTEKQCTNFQPQALIAFLTKANMNRHTARSIIHGPEEYGGLNIPHAYFLQSNGQLGLLVGHLRARDKTGTLILISMISPTIPFLWEMDRTLLVNLHLAMCLQS
jgi:hypothetical protein